MFRMLSVMAAMALGGVAQAGTYSLDQQHTEVIFSYNHAGLTTQHGEWTGISGEITFDPENVAATSATVTIDAQTLTTGVEALDAHLKSADFFDVEDHPKIVFTSTSAVQTGAETLRLNGELKIKGQSVPTVLDVTMKFMGAHPLGGFFEYYEGEWVGVEATSTVLRSELGVGMFAPLTSDVVQLQISAEMRKGGWPQ